MPQQLQAKMYFPSGGLNSDTNSLYIKDTEFAGVENLRIKPNQIYTRNGCKQYGVTGAGAPTDPILHFHAYKVPNGQEYYFAFTKNNVYKYTLASDKWLSVLDVSVTITTPVTFWSTTDYIDTTEGATIVAAGSIPVSDISAESDGANRILLYYDRVAGKFKSLVLTEDLDVVDEALGLDALAVFGSPQVSTTITLDNVNGTTKTLVPGSFVLSTDELGVVAYSDATPVDNGAGGIKYALIPVDETRIKGDGAFSYIYATGTKISIYWLGGTYDGLGLKVSYTYRTASGLKPRYVRGYYNRLMLGNIYDGTAYYPWRVNWGEIGQMTKAKYTSYQDLIDTDISPIMGWEEQGFYLTIVKRNCLYKVSHIGGDLVFLFQVAWKHGCPNGRTLKNYNSIQYLLGEDDVYQWDGSTLTSITLDQSTGNHRVKNEIMSKIQFSNVLGVFASLDLIQKEYWIWIPGTTETLAYVYSLAYNSWTKFKYGANITSASLGRAEVATSGIIDAAVGSFDTYGGTMNEAVETLDKVQFFGSSSGKVYISDEKVNLDFAVLSAGLYTGTSIPSYIITKDFIFNDVYAMDRTQRVELDLYGSECSIGWDGNYSLAPTQFKNKQTVALTSEWLRRYYYPDCVCYQVRLCIESTAYIAMRLINLYALTSRLSNR